MLRAAGVVLPASMYCWCLAGLWPRRSVATTGAFTALPRSTSTGRQAVHAPARVPVQCRTGRPIVAAEAIALAAFTGAWAARRRAFATRRQSRTRRVALHAAKLTVECSPAYGDDYASAAPIAVRALKWTDSPGINETLTEGDYRFLAQKETATFGLCYSRGMGGLQRTMIIARNEEQKVIGCIGCEVKYYDENTGKEIADQKKAVMLDSMVELPIMADLAVDPAFRQQGVARALVTSLEETVLGWGYPELLLFVEATNTGAIGLYEHLGYNLVEERPNTETAYLDGGGTTGKPRSVEKRSTLAYLYQKDLTGKVGPRGPFQIKEVTKAEKEEEDLRFKFDHPDQWQSVKNVLQGTEKAASPEIMARARYSAIKFREYSFLGSTERDEGKGIQERVEGWTMALGGSIGATDDSIAWAEELGRNIQNFLSGGDNMENLQEVSKFELIEATEDAVEFKVYCRTGKMLHEKDSYVKDGQYGYIYSGKSDFSEWSEIS
mmetsp:Transcript_57815/g.134647  ORF Transcript_57815/g.134647 Transcript_57815/m.134647 type:complete len:494 (+) Transcript_57815:40-1521(+)